MITAIDCNHSTNEILSASEDSFVNIWKVVANKNAAAEIVLSFSVNINDISAVGAAFKNAYTENSPLFVTAYEQEEIHVLQRAG